jgi:rubrerythrin
MLTAQVENLRIMARLVRDYDYREISRTLREAADTIENLRNRLTDQTCHNVARDREDLVCSVCGCYVENIGFDWSYCPSCGRRVVE